MKKQPKQKKQVFDFATGDTDVAKNLLAEGYIQHNTGIADGLSGLGAALEALGKQGIQMIYDQTYQVLADGNYGLAVSEGSFGGAHTSYYDLFRCRCQIRRCG